MLGVALQNVLYRHAINGVPILFALGLFVDHTEQVADRDIRDMGRMPMPLSHENGITVT